MNSQKSTPPIGTQLDRIEEKLDRILTALGETIPGRNVERNVAPALPGSFSERKQEAMARRAELDRKAAEREERKARETETKEKK